MLLIEGGAGGPPGAVGKRAVNSAGTVQLYNGGQVYFFAFEFVAGE